METAKIHKKLNFSTKSLFLSTFFGLFIGAAMVALFLYLYHFEQHSRLSARMAFAQAYPAEAMLVKETAPPTEPTTEPITYEMKINMQKVIDYHTENKDVIGWIYIPDTVVDYPVVQAYDNVYYMNRNWKGDYSYSGSIFADWRCLIDYSENSLLYGHNMGNGTMFHAVKYYKDEAWGMEHPYFEVATLEKRFLYKVLSVNVLNGLEGAAFEYWNCVNLNQREYADFITNIRNSAEVWYGDDENLPKYGKDRIITLQTCNSGAGDGIRCVLFAQCIGEY